MKEIKKTKQKKPTITDVMGSVQGLTVSVQDISVSLQDLTEAVQTGFAKHEEILTELRTDFVRHEKMLERHEKILVTLHEGQENLTARVGDIDHRLIATQIRVEDIADMFESTTDVVDESRDQIFDHEVRIKRLEAVPA